MPTRLMSVRDTLFQATQKVRSLSVIDNLTVLDNALADVDPALETLSAVQTEMVSTANRFSRERMLILARSTNMVLDGRKRALGGNSRKQRVPADVVHQLAKSAVTEHETWAGTATAQVAQLKAVKSQMGVLRHALVELARSSHNQAVQFSANKVEAQLGAKEAECTKTVQAASDLVGREREKIGPLLSELEKALGDLVDDPKSKGVRAKVSGCADDVLEFIAAG